MTHSYPPEPLGVNDFYGNHNYTFRRPTASFTTLPDTAYKGFVYFNISGELLTFRIYHSHTKTLEHSPSNPIFCTKRALQRLSRQTVLSCTHVPRGFEPCR